ncbi:MAG: LytTR family DNA-binding domain-containing protein [Bacteroidota bacterium]|nr:LytTR family DNA-binding domain-containing protein [Bacteroidota bacterium]
MKAVIIDDDVVSGELIARFLEKTGFIELQGNFTDPVKGLNYLHTNKTDVIFLDIEMPGMNGMEFLRSIKDPTARVILVTSHKEFAVEAFEHKVWDYLVKPFTYERFYRAVSRLNVEIPEGGDEIVFVKRENQMIRLRKSDILWAEAMGDYSVLYTDKDKFVLHSTLKAVEEKLPQVSFMRVHRSFIVRIDSIEKVEDNTIITSIKSIPIGKSYREEVFRRLKLF